jgi:uncharacterized protein
MKEEELTGEPFKGFVNVTQLLGLRVGSSIDYNISELLNKHDEGDVRGTITLIRSGKGIVIRGEASIDVELTCSRCLNKFMQKINFGINEEALYFQSMIGNDPLLDDDDLDEYVIDSRNMLDVGEIIRQYALLNLPMKALCTVDCNRNKEDV